MEVGEAELANEEVFGEEEGQWCLSGSGMKFLITLRPCILLVDAAVD